MDIEQLTNGGFNPLTSFMNYSELESVLEKMRLPSGEVWSIPILFPKPHKDIRTDEIRQALKDPVKRILNVIKDALEETPAELSSDIIDRGIVLAGGGSQLRGLDQVLREKTNVPVNVAGEPHLAIVKGCGAVIEDLEKYKHVLL